MRGCDTVPSSWPRQDTHSSRAPRHTAAIPSSGRIDRSIDPRRCSRPSPRTRRPRAGWCSRCTTSASGCSTTARPTTRGAKTGGDGYSAVVRQRPLFSRCDDASFISSVSLSAGKSDEAHEWFEQALAIDGAHAPSRDAADLALYNTALARLARDDFAGARCYLAEVWRTTGERAEEGIDDAGRASRNGDEDGVGASRNGDEHGGGASTGSPPSLSLSPRCVATTEKRDTVITSRGYTVAREGHRRHISRVTRPPSHTTRRAPSRRAPRRAALLPPARLAGCCLPSEGARPLARARAREERARHDALQRGRQAPPGRPPRRRAPPLQARQGARPRGSFECGYQSRHSSRSPLVAARLVPAPPPSCRRPRLRPFPSAGQILSLFSVFSGTVIGDRADAPLQRRRR